MLREMELFSDRSESPRRVAPTGQAGMTTGKDDKGFLSFPLFFCHSDLFGIILYDLWQVLYHDGTGASRKDSRQAGMT